MRRGRFAPTPSGDMHLGNAKIALLSWLQMRAAGGAFVLRIEDIDIQRSKPEITERIIADLRWLGLDWDEGPGADGPYGPYWQAAGRRCTRRLWPSWTKTAACIRAIAAARSCWPWPARRTG
ncbi:hypothetical protein HMSSN036_94460 [Paenibacillus macerans]|nr:hypothetical protein HMSSN036_94460 [Paenibacillus macerans]